MLARILILVILALTGCGSQKTHIVKDAPLVASNDEKFDLTVRPHESLGIKATPAILAGRVTVFKKFTISNRIFYGEEYAGRIRWNGWVVTPDSREYFAQVIRVKVSDKGRYEYKAIVDGLPEEIAGGRIIGLSSLVDFAVNFNGNDFPIIGKEYSEKRRYRYEIAAKFGTPVNDLVLDKSNFISFVQKLNTYKLKDEGYVLLCEYKEEDFRKIAEINPGYGLMEKFILNSKGQVTVPIIPEPTTVAVGTGVSLGMAMIDFLTSINARSAGWDYYSGIQDNETLAFKMLWLDKGREKFIEMQARKIADLEGRVAKNSQKGEQP